MLCPVSGSSSPKADVVSRHLGRASSSHEGEALGRIIGVERQVGGAGLERAEDGHDHLGRTLQADRHDVFGPMPLAMSFQASWFERASSCA